MRAAARQPDLDLDLDLDPNDCLVDSTCGPFRTCVGAQGVLPDTGTGTAFGRCQFTSEAKLAMLGVVVVLVLFVVV